MPIGPFVANPCGDFIYYLLCARMTTLARKQFSLCRVLVTCEEINKHDGIGPLARGRLKMCFRQCSPSKSVLTVPTSSTTHPQKKVFGYSQKSRQHQHSVVFSSVISKVVDLQFAQNRLHFVNSLFLETWRKLVSAMS